MATIADTVTDTFSSSATPDKTVEYSPIEAQQGFYFNIDDIVTEISRTFEILASDPGLTELLSTTLASITSNVSDSFSASDTFNRTVEVNPQANDVILYTDLITIISDILASEGIDITDTNSPSFVYVQILSELLSLNSRHSSALSIYLDLVEQTVLNTLNESAHQFSPQELLTISEEALREFKAFRSSVESLALFDSSENTYLYVLNTQDSFSVTDSTDFSLEFLLNAQDQFSFFGKLPLDDSNYLVLATNYSTLGSSIYQGLAFNSLVSHKGHTYGVASDGIYRMDSDTDNGNPIEAYIRTGMLDFNVMSQKTPEIAYLYVRSPNTLLVKTITDNRGLKKERWYEISAKDGESLTQRRRTFDRGVKASRIGLEIRNIDGGDFDLRGLQLVKTIHRNSKWL